MNNSSQKQLAQTLRQQGATFRQISQKLSIPLSTAHLWAKNIQLSTAQKALIQKKHIQKMRLGQTIALKAKRRQRIKLVKQLSQQGARKIGKVSKREMLLIGAALYWAEGFKKDTRLGFANSDPAMICFLIDWLQSLGVKKSDLRLSVGVNQAYRENIDSIQSFWSETTNIPKDQFLKPFFQKTSWRRDDSTKSTHYYGVLRIRANNQVKLFYTIKGLVAGLRTKFE